ncbi:hypothetical protein NM688_g6269 [Phlebia brevispora]|uniref:Uncharacterized protein n=1 Tax=Phlebia brevispora TaxID=194682 RepID=A0ACC1SHU2_9APHY|nr:hypothetical protein NM688_g6269 [Phlebia brevispora]
MRLSNKNFAVRVRVVRWLLGCCHEDEKCALRLRLVFVQLLSGSCAPSAPILLLFSRTEATQAHAVQFSRSSGPGAVFSTHPKHGGLSVLRRHGAQILGCWRQEMPALERCAPTHLTVYGTHISDSFARSGGLSRSGVKRTLDGEVLAQVTGVSENCSSMVSTSIIAQKQPHPLTDYLEVIVREHVRSNNINLAIEETEIPGQQDLKQFQRISTCLDGDKPDRVFHIVVPEFGERIFGSQTSRATLAPLDEGAATTPWIGGGGGGERSDGGRKLHDARKKAEIEVTCTFAQGRSQLPYTDEQKHLMYLLGRSSQYLIFSVRNGASSSERVPHIHGTHERQSSLLALLGRVPTIEVRASSTLQLDGFYCMKVSGEI